MKERTVFILDHTSCMSRKTKDIIQLDGISKLAVSFPDELKVYQKSVWTETIEAVIEYSRVIFDLFSTEKPIALLTADKSEAIHTDWNIDDQSIEALWNALSSEGPPPASGPPDLLTCTRAPGFDSILYLLRGLENSEFLRVIFVASSIESKVSSWAESIIESHKKASAEKKLFDKMEWCFINLTSMKLETEVSIPDNGESLAFSYVAIEPGDSRIYRGLMRLCEKHFDLASTMVQDIPMKEEANTKSSSSMYGVELIHSRGAHALLEKMGLLDSLLLRSTEESLHAPSSGFSQTVGIKWVTPKASDSYIFRYATASYRTTLVDVGNRASVCLAQFVLGGRSVVLAHKFDLSSHNNIKRADTPELQRTCCFDSCECECTLSQNCGANTANEVLLLTCHGSVMYIHVLATLFPQATPRLFPVISTASARQSHLALDRLRSDSFVVHVLKASRLAPASATIDYPEVPKIRALMHIDRTTRYWPLSSDDTVICEGVDCLAPLFEYLPREFIEKDELLTCFNAIKTFLATYKSQPEVIEFVAQTDKLHKKSSMFVAAMARLVGTKCMLRLLETAHFITEHACLSDEHEQLRAFWNKSLKIDAAESGNRLKLKDLLHYAFKAAHGLLTPGTPPAPNLPLKLLRSQLKKHAKPKATSEVNANPSQVEQASVSEAKRRKVSQCHYEIKPANPTAFLRALLPSTRLIQKLNTMHPEFEGVISIKREGSYQLYPNLKLAEPNGENK